MGEVELFGSYEDGGRYVIGGKTFIRERWYGVQALLMEECHNDRGFKTTEEYLRRVLEHL